VKRAEERKALMESYRKNRGTAQQPATPEERFNRLNAHLDRQLAYKSEMKKILSEAQFKKWNEISAHMRNSFREGRNFRKDGHSKR
jgi:protein CpxP